MNHSLDTNRAFLYGDGFFETFKINNGTCERFGLHYNRILQSVALLQMEWNSAWTQLFFEELLLTESKKFEESILKVRIIFYRKSAGTYLPEKDSTDFYLKLEPYVVIQKIILKAGIYPLAKKSCNFLSSLKTTSSLMFVMAAKFAKEKGWDEAIIINEYGRVCEALTSNIFLKKENIFYTPPLSEGCIDGINRKAFLSENKNVIEKPIEIEELKNHQIFFSNAVRGMVEGQFKFDNF